MFKTTNQNNVRNSTNGCAIGLSHSTFNQAGTINEQFSGYCAKWTRRMHKKWRAVHQWCNLTTIGLGCLSVAAGYQTVKAPKNNASKEDGIGIRLR